MACLKDTLKTDFPSCCNLRSDRIIFTRGLFRRIQPVSLSIMASLDSDNQNPELSCGERSAKRTAQNAMHFATIIDQHLEEKLKRELYQPGVIPRRGNRTEAVRAGEVTLVKLRFPVAGCPNCGILVCVEQFSPELKANRFREVEILKDRRIQVTETRPSGLLSTSSENRVVSLPNRVARGRLGKCAWGSAIEYSCAARHKDSGP